jgi:hypothetical protein
VFHILSIDSSKEILHTGSIVLPFQEVPTVNIVVVVVDIVVVVVFVVVFVVVIVVAILDHQKCCFVRKFLYPLEALVSQASLAIVRFSVTI